MMRKEKDLSSYNLTVRSLEILENVKSPVLESIRTESATANQTSKIVTQGFASLLSEFISDSILSTVEKKEIQRAWYSIYAEYPIIRQRALTAGYPTTQTQVVAYKDAYDALNTGLNGVSGVLVDMTTSSTIVPADFKALFDNYDSAKEGLVSNISAITFAGIITGGVAGIKWDATGTIPTPSSVSPAFSAALTVDTVNVSSDCTFAWSCYGHLTGTGANQTFTPSISNPGINDPLPTGVICDITYNGVTTRVIQSVTAIKAYAGIPWIADWDGAAIKTTYDSGRPYILAGGVYAGTTEADPDNPGYFRVAQGVFMGKGRVNGVSGDFFGLVAIQNGVATFKLDGATGAATFGGALSAPTGNIGGFTIGATRLSSTNLFIDQAGQYISMGATPPTAYGDNVGAWFGVSTSAKMSLYADASNYFKWDGSKLLVKSANFTLDSSGNIAAAGGTVGAFTINTHLYTGAKTSYSDGLAGVHVGSDGIGLGANFSVSNTGVVNAQRITALLQSCSIGEITAGDTYVIKADTLETTPRSGGDYAVDIAKSLQIAASGTVRVVFSAKCTPITENAQAQIYVNGVAAGTLRNVTTTYQTWTQDITITAGVVVQIAVGMALGSVLVKDFYIKANEQPGILSYLGIANDTGIIIASPSISITRDESTDVTRYPLFAPAYSGSGTLRADSLFTYNPSTGLLSTAKLTTSSDVVVGGNLYVNGTVTTINSTELTVDDKNITLGSVATPTDITADGGGITLKGATDKTIIWDDANDNWTLNQNVNIPTGLSYKINNVSVLSATTLGASVVGSSLTSVGTLTSLVVSGNTRLGGTDSPVYPLDVNGTVRAERYIGINSLVLNTFTTINPASNVFLYSQSNDRDSWLFLDSADTGSNWGIYHRQIDSPVSGLPANSIAFIGGGSSALNGYINLANGSSYFRGGVDIATDSVYKINGTSVLSAAALGSSVVGSSLTSVGTLTTGIWQATAITDTYLATISTAGKVANSATTATSANTASAIVARDGSGDFAVHSITAYGLIYVADGLYTPSNINIRNKADNAWLTFAARDTSGSEAVYNLSNVGTITAVSITAALTGTVGATTPTTGKFTTIESTNIAALTTIAESWIGPSSTAGIYFKSGNVGIGTTTPVSLFNIHASSPTLTMSMPTGGPTYFIDFQARDQTQPVQGRISVIDDGNFGVHFSFLSKANSSSGALSEKFRIASNGYVGIGTTSPQDRLDVYNGGLRVGNVSVAGFLSYDTAVTFGSVGNYALKIFTNSIEKLRVGTDGSLTPAGTFTSGSLGAGWKLDYNASVASKSYLEIDNIRVRDTLYASVFQKDIIRVSNGQFYISDSGIVVSIDGTYVYFDPDKSATFSSGQRLEVKDIKISTGLAITSVKFDLTSGPTVTAGGSRYTYTLISGAIADIDAGATAARISGGNLLADAVTANSPFLDVRYDYVTKARLGALSGITSPTMGTLSGWGLWSDNVYLEGNANIVGTLAVGGGSTIGNTFYVGKINKNYFKYSESATGWVSNGSVLTTINTDTPEGTGSVCVSTGNAGYGPYRTDVSLPSGYSGSLTISVWARQISGSPASFKSFFYDDTAHIDHGTYHVLTSGWVRYSWTFDNKTITNPATSNLAGFYCGTDAVIQFWGMQWELSSTATPYQKTDATLSSSTGYGMWATAGGFGGTMQNPVVALGDYGLKVLGAGAAATLSANSIMIGNITGTANSALKLTNTGTQATSGLFGYNSAGTEQFKLALDGTAQIAGWMFDSSALYNSQGAAYDTAGSRVIELNAAAGQFGLSVRSMSSDSVYTNLSVGRILRHGTAWDDKFGINFYRSGLGTLFEISTGFSGNGALVAQIAGWNFNATDLYSGGIHLVSSATAASNKIYIGTGTYNNANTAFYVDGSGQFSLKDKLTWNGSTLTINGGGTFTGALSIGTGDSIFKANTDGISLGHATFADAPFSVTPAGSLKALAGVIGQLTLADGVLSSNNIRISPDGLVLGVGVTDETQFGASGFIFLDGASNRMSLGENLIYENNLLTLTGDIKSANYVSGVSGYRLSGVDNVFEIVNGIFNGQLNGATGTFIGDLSNPVFKTFIETVSISGLDTPAASCWDEYTFHTAFAGLTEGSYAISGASGSFASYDTLYTDAVGDGPYLETNLTDPTSSLVLINTTSVMMIGKMSFRISVRPAAFNWVKLVVKKGSSEGSATTIYSATHTNWPSSYAEWSCTMLSTDHLYVYTQSGSGGALDGFRVNPYGTGYYLVYSSLLGALRALGRPTSSSGFSSLTGAFTAGGVTFTASNTHFNGNALITETTPALSTLIQGYLYRVSGGTYNGISVTGLTYLGNNSCKLYYGTLSSVTFNGGMYYANASHSIVNVVIDSIEKVEVKTLYPYGGLTTIDIGANAAGAKFRDGYFSGTLYPENISASGNIDAGTAFRIGTTTVINSSRIVTPVRMDCYAIDDDTAPLGTKSTSEELTFTVYKPISCILQVGSAGASATLYLRYNTSSYAPLAGSATTTGNAVILTPGNYKLSVQNGTVYLYCVGVYGANSASTFWS